MTLLRRRVCLISVLIKAALIGKAMIILFKSHYTIIAVIDTIKQPNLFDLKLLLILLLLLLVRLAHLRALCLLGLELYLQIFIGG